jgi:hypothetical protein
MNPIASIAAVFAAGLTLFGLLGSLIELVSERRLTLREPFVARSRVAASLFLAAAAGPYMLVNDALGALRERRIGALLFSACLAMAAFWIFAAGILITELAVHVRALLLFRI